MLNMKKILLITAIFSNTAIIGQTNVQNHLNVKNTQLFYSHFHRETKFSNGKDFFKPYLGYSSSDIPNKVPLMDSFILCDLGYNNIGRYDSEMMELYLDNVFTRTKIPIRRTEINNKYGVINYKRTTGLAYKIDSFEAGIQTLSFDIKALTSGAIISNIYNDLILGIEYFDTNGQEIGESDWPGGDYSPYVGMFYKNINFNEGSRNFYNFSIGFECPPTATSYKIHILNWNLGADIGYSKIAIDNVILTSGSNPINKIDTLDSNFNFNDLITKWEYLPQIYHGEYLFNVSRNALIDEINEAHSDIFTDPDIPKTKLILQIPVLDPFFYQTVQSKIQLKTDLNNYIDNISNRFNNWKLILGNKNVEITGVYCLKERIDFYEGNEAFLLDIFGDLKTKLQEKGWKLYGSPYHNIYDCSTESTFSDDIIKLFDLTWQQPGAFYASEVIAGNKDRELLKKADLLTSVSNININIENRVLGEDEHYGRINDYFDYGDKYGYINYSKVYYDDRGAHYKNAVSNEPSKRVDYDNLYKFIQKSQKGEIINSEFEIIDEYDNTKLHDWTGNYLINTNVLSSNNQRFLKFITDLPNFINSEHIPILQDQLYNIKFEAKELINDSQTNSALIGVRFFDENGTAINTAIINGLDYSTGLNSYYKYFNTTTTFDEYTLNFISPPNTISFQFYLKKWKSADIEWKSFIFYKNTDIDKSRLIYKSASTLKIEEDYRAGNYSLKLGLNQFATTYDTISISPNNSYSLKILTKEELPLITNPNNKALIAIEAFDQFGAILGGNISIGDFIYNSSLGMHYRYLPINQTWTEYSKVFQFPPNVASIIIYMRNWYHDGNILIDGISFELVNGPNLKRTLNFTNILDRDNWNEKLPLTVSKNESAFYNSFIDVHEYSNIEFSALIRGSGNYPEHTDLLAIEFYDNNYKFLTDSDLSSVSLSYSNYYNYWWSQNYINIDYTSCEDFFRNKHTSDDDPSSYWFDNQWHLYEQDFDIPIGTHYVKIYFQKNDGIGEYLVLNPQMIGNSLKNSIGYSANKKEIFHNSKLEMRGQEKIQLFPNPTKKNITIQFENEDINYSEISVCDINGRILNVYNLDKKSEIDVSHLASGIYFITIQSKGAYLVKKFIKD